MIIGKTRFALLVGMLLSGVTACAQGTRATAPTNTTGSNASKQGSKQYAAIDRQVQAIKGEFEWAQLSGQPTPQLQQSLQRLTDMMPGSPRTRELRKQACRLYQQLKMAASEAEADSLHKELDIVLEQVASDSEYAAALKYLDQKLVRQVKGVTAKATSRAFTNTAKFPFGELRAGDVLLWEDRSGGLQSKIFDFIYARTFTHAAIYLGDRVFAPQGTRLTYEALNPSEGVRVCNFDGRWTRKGLHVALGHVNNVAQLNCYVALVKAHNTFGDNGSTPYHLSFPWDKRYLQNGLYCSQLPWVVYNWLNVDLDSNDLGYDLWFALRNFYEPYAFLVARDVVFPDEIYSSANVSWYYNQNNP